jgi:prepilin signal peptidase PulO-like enzyme (type II secretory pathway)
VELLTGALFAFALLAEQAITPHGVLAIVLLWVISAACIVTFIIDFEHYLILNTVTFWATVLVILVRVCLVLFGGRSISQELYSGGVGLLVGVLPLYALWFLSRGRWIGFGDVKFMFFAGIALGWPGVLIGLLFSYWLGALVAVPLLIFGRKTLGSKIPFGTFLAVGVVLAAYFATPVWEWYWQLLA